MKKEYIINDKKVLADVTRLASGMMEIEIEGQKFQFEIEKTHSANEFMVTNTNTKKSAPFVASENYFYSNGKEFKFVEESRTRGKKVQAPGSMLSPMPGKILKVMVNAGDKVEVGTPLLVLEAMKMEHTIKANTKGIIEKIKFNIGDQVSGGVELVQIKE